MSFFLELVDQPINLFVTLVYFPETASTSYHDLSRYEYQERHLRMLQSVHKSRKQLRHELDLRRFSLLLVVLCLHLLQVNWEFGVCRSDHILDLEL